MWYPDAENKRIGRSKEKRRTDWVENSISFDFQEGQSVEQTKQHVGISFSSSRALGLLVAFLLAFLLLSGRLGTMQVISGESYAQAADDNSRRIRHIPAERGQFFDKDGVALTENIPNFSLALTPQDLPRDTIEREYVVRNLAELTGQETKEIRDKLERFGSYSYESIIIEEGLDYDTALSIQIAAGELPGIHIQRGSKRLYLHDGAISLSHLLGYTGKLSPEELDVLYTQGYLPSDTIGKTGLERTYEEVLRGTYGKRHLEVDSRGREQSTLSEEPPIPGRHLALTLDIDMQRALTKAVQDALDISGKSRAAAIALDPRDGSIRAMVSLPAYDNNDFSGGIEAEKYRSYIDNTDRPLFNRAISGTYPSGSTVKPAVAAAALQEGIINRFTTFVSSGGLQVSRWFFPDWLGGGHGVTDVRKSIADSVNTFYYYIGGGYRDIVGLGVDRIVSYLRSFGFAQKLGVDLPGEQSGFLPSKAWKERVKNERWYIGDTYNLSIGQGDLLVTPLQIAALTAAVANGGTIHTPHLVDHFLDASTGEIVEKSFSPFGEVSVDKGHLRTVALGMRDCVTDGSCRRLSLLPFTSAGKTGTAQWHSKRDHHAWFTSFAPFERPELVVTVLVEEGGGGAAMAAPIAYDFFKWWGAYGL